MRATGAVSRALVLGLVMALVGTTFPEAAAADHDSCGRKKKHRKKYRREVVVVERGCAPAACGPIWYVPPPPPPPPPVYFDPACGRSFTSFGLYVEHVQRHGRVSIAFGTGWSDRGVAVAAPYVRPRRSRCDD